jgi:hypothetical protein
MTRKTTLRLTPAPIDTNIALAKAERSTACGCFDRSRPFAVKIGPLVTTVTWRSVKDELPDDTITVLMACSGEADAEQGYHCDGRWLFGDGYVAKRVYAWAHMPATPRAGRGKKGGAS